MYKLIKRENHARRGELQTVHGTVQTPAFMNVGFRFSLSRSCAISKKKA